MVQGLEIILEERGVVVVRIARPPDNAFTPAMCRELAALLADPPRGARLLRLTADGPVFCRGREPSGKGAEAARATLDALTDVTRLLAGTSLVTVAEVAGEAAGFGVGLVAQCDVAVASRAARFWFPEVTYGLAPALVLSWLPRLVGRRQAFWLTASGSILGAAEAQSLGMVTMVAEADQLGSRVEDVISTLLRYPAAVQREIKRLLADFQSVEQSVAYGMARDRLLISALTDGGPGD
ncbi:MAG: enoyl-CoA hydratase/isomerase family protein [Candidatus Dormibacteria bacterium]